jgi:hypothetical protein
MGSSKGNAAATVDTVKVIKVLQMSIQNTEAIMSRVEEASNHFGVTQKKMVDKLDGICMMLAQLNASSEFGSAQRLHPTSTSPSPPPPTGLSPNDMAFIKRQEAQGKISILNSHLSDPTTFTTDTTDSITFTMSEPNNTIPHHMTLFTPIYTLIHQTSITPCTHTNLHQNNTEQTKPPNYKPNLNTFSLSIARPKVDFPVFSGEEPFNWLRQCEKYFSLANVPIKS